MAAEKGQVIPLNWQASPEEIDYGIKLGFSAFEVKEMAEDMRLWALSNRNRTVARKADWHLTFLGWMRRQKQRTQSPHEKSYAEIADDIRNGSGDDYAGSGGTAVAANARDRHNH